MSSTVPSQAAQDAADAQRALHSMLGQRAAADARQQRRLHSAAASAAAAKRRRRHSSEDDDDEEEEDGLSDAHSDSDGDAAAGAAAPARAGRSKAARIADPLSGPRPIDPLAVIRATKQAQLAAAAAAEASHQAAATAAASSRGATAVPASASAAAASASDDAVWPLELSHAAVRTELDDVDWEGDDSAAAPAAAAAASALLHQSSLTTQQATQPLDDGGDLDLEGGAASADPDGVDRAAWHGQNEEVLFGEEDDDGAGGHEVGDQAAAEAQQLAQIDAEERAARAAAAETAARKAAADDPMLLNRVVLKASASAPASAASAAHSNGGPLEISFEAPREKKGSKSAAASSSAAAAAAAAAAPASAAARKSGGAKGGKKRKSGAEPDIIVPPAGAAGPSKRARSGNEVDMDALFGEMSDDAADADEADDADDANAPGSASKRKKASGARGGSSAKKKVAALPIPPSQRMNKDNKELVLAVHRVHVLSMLFLWRQYSSPLSAQCIMDDENLLACLLSIALNKVPHLRSKGFTLDPRKPAVWVGAKKKGGGSTAAAAAAAAGGANQGLKWKTSHGAGASAAAAAAASSSSSDVPPASEGTVFDRVQKLAYWFRGYFRCHGDRITLPLSDKKHPLHAVDARMHSKIHNILRCTCIRQRIIHTAVAGGGLQPQRWVHYKHCIVSQLRQVLSTREGGFEHLTMLFCMLLRQSHVLARMCYGLTAVNYREGIVFPTKAASGAHEERHAAAGEEMLQDVLAQFGIGVQFGSEGGGGGGFGGSCGFGGGFAQMLRAQSLPSHSSSSAAASSIVFVRPGSSSSGSGVPPSPQALLVLRSAKQEKCPCKAPFKPVVYTSIDDMISEEKALAAAKAASTAAAPAAAAAASSSSSAAAAAAASPSKPSPHFPVPPSPQQQQQRKKESFLSAAAAGAIEILDDSDDELMEVTLTKASPRAASPAVARQALGALANDAAVPAAAAASVSPAKRQLAPPSAASASSSASPAAPAVAAVSSSPPSFRAAKSKPVNYAETDEDEEMMEERKSSEEEDEDEEEEEEAAPKPKRRGSVPKAKAKAKAGSAKSKNKRATKAAASAAPADDDDEIEDVTPATSNKKKKAAAPRKPRKKAGSDAAAAASPEDAANVDLALPGTPPLVGLVGVLAKAKPRRSRSTQAAADASFDAATAEAARAAEFDIDSDVDRLPASAAAAAAGFSSTTASAAAAASKRAQKQYFEHGYPLVWIEFYSPEERRWIHLDLLRELFDSPGVYEHDGGLAIEYVIAVRPSVEGRQPLLSDVTKRYASQWTKTLSQRLDESWFTAELARLSGPCAPLDRDLENSDAADLAALHSASESAMPTSLSAFKAHPLWCLELHCGKFEAIYPKGAEHSRGVFVEKRRAKEKDDQPAATVNHLIYPRASLHTLHTIDRWRREQRAVKDSEVPYPVKSVKRNAHMSKEAAARKAALGLVPPGGERSELYGIWQTEAWMPAAATGDGLVPKNARGHVDVWGASHVPGGCVHLKLPEHEGSFGALSRAARKLGVDYAKAMVGFDVARHGSVPRFEGIVVLAEHAEAVRSMARSLEAAASDRAEKKRMAKINEGWRRLVKGNLVRMRVMQQMDEQGQASMPGTANAGAVAAAPLANMAYGSIALAGRAAAAAGDSSASSGAVLPPVDHVHAFDAKSFDPDRNEWSAVCRCGARQTFEEI